MFMLLGYIKTKKRLIIKDYYLVFSMNNEYYRLKKNPQINAHKYLWEKLKKRSNNPNNVCMNKYMLQICIMNNFRSFPL